ESLLTSGCPAPSRRARRIPPPAAVLLHPTEGIRIPALPGGTAAANSGFQGLHPVLSEAHKEFSRSVLDRYGDNSLSFRQRQTNVGGLASVPSSRPGRIHARSQMAYPSPQLLPPNSWKH